MIVPEIRECVRSLAGGNQDFGLLLRWAAVVDKERLVGKNGKEVEEALLERINGACRTSLRRVDLVACGEEYWQSDAGKEAGQVVAQKAELLRRRVASIPTKGKRR